MPKIICERLELLRKLMGEKNVDTFLLTKFDPHQSEYSKDKWNYVKYFSGFTGSAGTVVVTKEKAAFWTDGRYSLQSQSELKGTEFEIFNTSNPNCCSYEEYIKANTPENGSFSFDERTLSLDKGKSLINYVKAKNIEFKSGVEIINNAATGPFDSIDSEVIVHDIKYSGLSTEDKLKQVRAAMEKLGATRYILSSLEDIAWLYNLRSKTEPTLSFEAYTIVSADKAALFVKEHIIAPVKNVLISGGVEIYDYDYIFDYIAASINKNSDAVVIAPSKTCYALHDKIKDFKVINIEIDITADLKAVKNSVEIENTKHTSIIDGVSLVKFIKWIKEAAKTSSVTEYEAGLKLDEIRAREETFLRPSFSTICGYGPNGSIIHYRAKEEGSLVIKPEGLLLVDSGGNYLGGTTDITRTIVLGKLSGEMIENFTLVLKCHIALAAAVFMEGTSGHYIDILARKPLWDNLKDYKHGTGHGIGFALSVHEGPQRIANAPNNVAIKPGMMISNEPGFYKDGEYGVRSENIILAKEYGESNFGKFYNFETISFAPFDLEAIDKNLLTPFEIQWLNDYHADVYNKLSPGLDDEERAWLKEQTRSI